MKYPFPDRKAMAKSIYNQAKEVNEPEALKPILAIAKTALSIFSGDTKHGGVERYLVKFIENKLESLEYQQDTSTDSKITNYLDKILQ